MFDIGWMELMVIGVVALIVVGPKDLPVMFRTVGRFMGKARGMAREFQRTMEAAADESGLKEASKSLQALDRLSTATSIGGARTAVKAAAKGAVAGTAASGAAAVVERKPLLGDPVPAAAAVDEPPAVVDTAADTPVNPAAPAVNPDI